MSEQVTLPKDAALSANAAPTNASPIPSPREERVGRGLGRGAAQLEKSTSSPRPSPPLCAEEREKPRARACVGRW